MSSVSIESLTEHKVSEVICVKCYKRWISVRPTSVMLKNLECPQCKQQGYVIETGEVIDKNE